MHTVAFHTEDTKTEEEIKKSDNRLCLACLNECDGQTDRRTERLSVAWRGKTEHSARKYTS